MRPLNVIFLSSVVVAAGSFACSSSDSSSNTDGGDAGDTSIPDSSVATETPVEGASCTTDGLGTCNDSTSALRCRDGKWTKVGCRGPGGCSSDGGMVCDRSFDEVGADCRGLEGSNACSVDKKNILECADGGVWSIFSDCTTLGAECTVAPGEGILCD